MYNRVSKVGFKFFLFAFLTTVLGLVANYVLNRYYYDFAVEYSDYISLAMTAILYYALGFPFIVLLTGNIPITVREKSNISFGRFLKFVAITAGLAGIGTVIGIVPHYILTMSGSSGQQLETTTDLLGIVFDTNQFIMVGVVGILAPIFEELLFRKVLVDRLSGYGETLAIVASGLMFGLFHGNFQQAVFAALIGGFFAYVYLRTGRIIYTILLHMCVNLTTSVGTVTIYKWFFSTMDDSVLDALNSGDYNVLYEALASEQGLETILASLVVFGWLIFLLSMVVTGIVFIIISLVKKQFVIMPVEGESSKGKQVGVIFISWGMLLFIAVCVFAFFKTYTGIVPKIFEFIDDFAKSVQ